MSNPRLTRRQTIIGGAALSFLPARGVLAKAMVKITAAEAVETMYYLPLYVAKERGFFEQEGLDVTIFNAQQRTIALRAVIAKDAFSYNGDPAEPALAQQKGENVKNIGVLVNRAAQVVLGKAGTSKDPKSWAGQTIIVPRPPHTAVSLIQMTLIDAGYAKTDTDGLVWTLKGGKPADAVRLIPVVAGSELSALMAGQAQLGLTNEPGTSNGVAAGLEIVISFAEQFGPFYFTSFAVLGEVIAKQPELVQAFANAMTKAMIYGHKNPDGAAEVAVKRYSDSDPKIMKAAAERIIAQGAYPENLVVTKASYDNNFTRLLTATAHPAAGYPFDKLMDLSFAETAAKTIKPEDI